MDEQDIKALIARYNNGTATPEERIWLDNWYRVEASGQQLSVEELPLSEQEERLLQGTLERAGLYQQAPVRRLWPRIAAAASILIACGAGLYYQHNKPQQITQQAVAKHDIAPGHSQATLTLSNGQKIILTKNLQGQIATQGKTSITANGQHITYENTQQEDQVTYNTLSTAKGEQSPYPLVLADGTKAWLNAESSITFPVAFNSNDRTVTVTGEVYFEVVHNDKQPFKVKTASQTIEDIGTHFNVNAYNDEPATITTLLEGTVKVNNYLLKPGQQCDGTHITEANTDAVMAWRTGYFQFDDEHIEPIMRRVARWYNVDVVYNGDAPTTKFYGYVPRFSNVSQVLKKLEYSNNVHFKIEGRRIMVSR